MPSIVDIFSISRRKKYDYESDKVKTEILKILTEAKKELHEFKGNEPVLVIDFEDCKKLAVAARIDIDSWKDFEKDYGKKAIEHTLGTAKECLVRYFKSKGLDKRDIRINNKARMILIFNPQKYL